MNFWCRIRLVSTFLHHFRVVATLVESRIWLVLWDIISCSFYFFQFKQSHINLTVPIHKCFGKHSCTSSIFSIAILNRTCSKTVISYGSKVLINHNSFVSFYSCCSHVQVLGTLYELHIFCSRAILNCLLCGNCDKG